jgi:hypothetical protein
MLATAAAACDDRESPAGPPGEPGHGAVATVAGYTIKSLGTLGGANSRAFAVNSAWLQREYDRPGPGGDLAAPVSQVPAAIVA